MCVVPKPLEEAFLPITGGLSSDARKSSLTMPSLAGLLEERLQTLT